MKSDAFLETTVVATANANNSTIIDENTIKRRYPNFFSVIFIFILLISLSVIRNTILFIQFYFSLGQL